MRAQPAPPAISRRASGAGTLSCWVLGPWSCQGQQKGFQEARMTLTVTTTSGCSVQGKPALQRRWGEWTKTPSDTVGKVTYKSSRTGKLPGKSALPSEDGQPKQTCPEGFLLSKYLLPDQLCAWPLLPWASSSMTQSCSVVEIFPAIHYLLLPQFA